MALPYLLLAYLAADRGSPLAGIGMLAALLCLWFVNERVRAG
jgi:hypothetical protein